MVIITMKIEPLEILKKHCVFKSEYEVYVILGVARKKNNPLTNAQEIVFREVIKNEDDIIRKYYKITGMCRGFKDKNGIKYNFYIYVTQNPRHIVKAFFQLRRDMDNWIENIMNGNKESSIKNMKRVSGKWISALMKKESRSSKSRFIIDVDSIEKEIINTIRLRIHEIGIKVHHTISTKNGYHIVCDPFDSRSFFDTELDMNKIEIKKDDLLFVEYVK